MESVVTPLNSRRMLLVEDDPIIQKIHKAYLLKMGYEVDIVASGEHAISIYSNDYDAIILDVNLPHLDGISVAKYIRQQELANKKSPIPIILLSAYSQEYLSQECLQAGINAFATKPIAYEALKAMLFEQLQKSFSNREFFDRHNRSFQR